MSTVECASPVSLASAWLWWYYLPISKPIPVSKELGCAVCLSSVWPHPKGQYLSATCMFSFRCWMWCLNCSHTLLSHSGTLHAPFWFFYTIHITPQHIVPFTFVAGCLSLLAGMVASPGQAFLPVLVTTLSLFSSIYRCSVNTHWNEWKKRDSTLTSSLHSCGGGHTLSKQENTR